MTAISRWWSSKVINFPVNLRESKGWFIFLVASYAIDALITTRIGLDIGFTEKGLIPSRLLPISYWLMAAVSIVGSVLVGLGALFFGNKNVLIIVTITVYGMFFSNIILVLLAFQGVISPF